MDELINNARDFLKRSGSSTRVATANEIKALKERLGDNFPEWLENLMSTVPICDSKLVIQINEDIDLQIEFLDPEIIIEETYDAIPGCAVYKEGYICIGTEAHIGDAYAINFYEGNNPPVYLLDHDYGEDTEQILNNKQRVVRKLSDLFLVATLEI